MSYKEYRGFSVDDFKMIIDEAMKVARERSGQMDADSSDGIFYRGKVETAQYFCRNILTNVFARHMTLQQEDTSALDIPEEFFSAGKIWVKLFPELTAFLLPLLRF